MIERTGSGLTDLIDVRTTELQSGASFTEQQMIALEHQADIIPSGIPQKKTWQDWCQFHSVQPVGVPVIGQGITMSEHDFIFMAASMGYKKLAG